MAIAEWIIPVVLILSFFGLVLIRVPVAYALIIPSALYLVLNGMSLLPLAQRMTRQLFSFTLLTVPLFILVGTLMNHSGQTNRIFKFANDLLGHINGGLAYVNILASLIFSGISGSAIADVGGIGQILIKSMEDQGYDSDYSAALTGASSTIGPIFPPSIPLIIFGVLAEVSILKLLLAGIVPAILATIVLAITTYFIGLYHEGFPETDKKYRTSKLAKSFISAFPSLFTPIILIFGMITGIFSPTEVAAVAVAYIVIINIVFYRDIDVKYIWKASREAVRTTTVVLFILAGAGIFSFILTIEGVPRLIGEFLFDYTTNPLILLLIVNIILLLLGMFIEPLSAMIMGIPVFVPPLVQLGVDPVQVGVIVVLNLMIGLLTPPLGLVLFVGSDIAEAPVENIVSELKPYYVGLIIVLLAVTFIPELSLWTASFA